MENISIVEVTNSWQFWIVIVGIIVAAMTTIIKYWIDHTAEIINNGTTERVKRRDCQINFLKKEIRELKRLNRKLQAKIDNLDVDSKDRDNYYS